jgi:hypothetical protein
VVEKEVKRCVSSFGGQKHQSYGFDMCVTDK